MADLYGTNAYSSSPSPSTTGFALDSEDISSFIHHLLHNSSTPPSSSCASFKAKHLNSFSSHPPPPPPPPPPETTSNAGLLEDRRRFCQSAILSDSDCRVRDETYAAGSSLVVDSSSSLNLSDPGCYSPANVKNRTENTFYSVGLTDSDAITSSLKPRKFPAESDVDEGTEVSEVPLNPVPPRASSSSKRSRAAEVHNLSEKRRRSRINEKMKALQNLIPNSNKTDKASMLDEAIEYLKQLQLQVQMLSMRNGFNLHPIYLPGVLQPMQLSQTGMGFDEGNGLLNTNRGTDTFSENQGTSMRIAFDLSNQCIPSNQSIVIPTMTNITKAENSFGLQPSVQAHSGPFNLSTSSKEICREDTLPHLQLDTSGSGKNS